MSMQRVMGGRGLERGPRGSKRAHSRGTIVLKSIPSAGRMRAKKARGAAPRRRHNGPGACSTVSVYPMERARCVGAAEPHRSRRRQVCMVVAKENERRTNVGSA